MNSTSLSRVIATLILIPLLVSALPGPSTLAGASAATLSAAIEEVALSFDPADVATFFDERMSRDLVDYGVPGAAVAVVEDGAVVLSKGYGNADMEQQRPVEPERSLFRIASLTKLFTWTAVMQLVEQGRLDLDADVNTHLQGIRVPATYKEPVTLRSLMTHTAGFEDRGIGTLARSVDTFTPLASYLAAHLPARVRPPGEVAMYSNHGAALAGLIVEQVSGQPYEEYVAEHILTPLGMTHTTAHQPVPDALLPDLAASYAFFNGNYRLTSFQFDLLRPAGGMSASAGDMARFMLAHLGNGQYGDATILRAETTALMHSQAFTHHPDLPGWALGFQEMDINGRRVLFHDGSFQSYISLLVLSPEDGLGLFVVYNAGGGGRALDALLQDFFDRFYPAPAPGVSPADETTSATSLMAGAAGTYVSARRPYTTIEKLSRDVPEAELIAGKDGTIWFLGRTWVPVSEATAAAESAVYRDADGEDRLAFLTDAAGRVTGAAVGAFAMDRLPWHRRSSVAGGLMGAAGLILLSSLIVWPISGLVARGRRRRGPVRTEGSGSTLPRLARWIAAAAAVITIVDLVALVLLLAGSPLIYGVPPAIGALTTASFLVVLLAAAVVVFAIVAWLHRFWSLPGRIHYTLVSLALVAVVWLMITYNILGPHLG